MVVAHVVEKTLQREEQLGSLKGVKVTRNEVEVMADCVEKYCRWSGQTVNLAKSGIITSKNFSRASLQSLSRNWGCWTINLDSKSPFGNVVLVTLFVFFRNMWVKNYVEIRVMLFKH